MLIQSSRARYAAAASAALLIASLAFAAAADPAQSAARTWGQVFPLSDVSTAVGGGSLRPPMFLTALTSPIA